MKPEIIALYLPQYHPTQSNDSWYGKGFTEWTNVSKARSLYHGHYQPKIPGDLGFYDLRLDESREEQAQLAREYGISAFCYYYYRFSPTHRELDTPIRKMLESGKPDFPFMICWVNESWYKKFWSSDATCTKETLAEQVYKGKEDYKAFFDEVLPFLIDKRYYRIHGKPAFMIYNPLNFPDLPVFMETWTKLAKERGLPGITFMVYSGSYDIERESLDKLGVDAVVSCRLFDFLKTENKFKKKGFNLLRRFFKVPHVISYRKASKHFIGKESRLENVYPTIIPNWDHTPRSGAGGWVLHGSTPELFKKHVENAIEAISGKKPGDQIIFLKSWNEWGEGNYIEPDLRWGRGYLEALRESLGESTPLEIQGKK